MGLLYLPYNLGVGCDLLMIIFTPDPTPFMEGNYVVMYRHLTTAPVQSDVTYILHSDKFKTKEVEMWGSLIKKRLVIVTDKNPKLGKSVEEYVVVDDRLLKKKKNNFFSSIKALFTWGDRNRVSVVMREVPIPLALSFLRANDVDIEVWRSIAKTNKVLPEDYTRAVMVYSMKPRQGKIEWPTKKKVGEEKPDMFRESDEHWEIITRNYKTVANELRLRGEDLPKGIRKRKEAVNEWV